MMPIDAATLKDRLFELADVYGAKQPTEHALRVWFHTLKEFQIQDVAGFLIGWPKRASKMPTPGDVWSKLNEQRTEDLEQKAAAEKAANERAARSFVRTEQGVAELAALRQARKGRARETVAEKCLRNSRDALARHAAGKIALPPWVADHHRARANESTPEREPGSDFEEDCA